MTAGRRRTDAPREPGPGASTCGGPRTSQVTTLATDRSWIAVRWRSRRLASLAALVLLASGPSRADAAAPPDEHSAIGTSATVQRALQFASSLPRSSAGRVAAEPGADACRALPVVQPDCPALDVARCSIALRALYDALARGSDDADDVTRNLSRVGRTLVSDALSRLTWARPRDGEAGCASPLEDGRTAATIQVSGDGRTLRVRPLRPLRAGRAYQLVVEGLASDASIDWHAGSAGRSAADLERDLVDGYDTVFSGAQPRFRDGDARALLKRLAAEASALPDVPAAAGAQGTLRRAVDAAALSRLRAWFEPATTDAHRKAVLRFRTFDPRAGLVAYRELLARNGCAPYQGGSLALEPVDVGLEGAAIAGVYRGRFRSLDLAGDDRTSRILGVDPDVARPIELSFLLALPAGFSAGTPVVLALHGHGGRAETMLKTNAIGLARRGMATLALDLPAHGERGREEPFVDPLHPERLTLGIRQATVDALALLHAGASCGFQLPDGERFTPRTLRYLGYSLGAAIGVLLRAVEPELGTTVLVAPPGDLVEWQVQQVPKRLGAETYTGCSGGAAHGRPCRDPSACGPDGTCVFDPQIILLSDVVSSSYGALFGGADPVAFAGERTGSASTAPLLLIAGGLDTTIGLLVGPRLADIYGLKLTADGGRRGAGTRFAYWPGLGHELFANETVREQAYDFLMTGGRQPHRP